MIGYMEVVVFCACVYLAYLAHGVYLRRRLSRVLNEMEHEVWALKKSREMSDLENTLKK